MKLVRYGPRGREKPGLIDAQGRLRDLSAHCATLGWDELSPAGLKRLAALDPRTLPAVRGEPRLGVPFTGISKFIGIGLNYRDHAIEAGMAIPSEPIVFMKATSCINGPCDPILLPPGSVKTDWEVELGIVIGREARRVAEAKALDHVAGYCVINDVSEREYQLERGSQWDKGKGCDSFGPIGPWLVTKDEVPDPQNLRLWLELNGERVQDGSTATMIFGVREIVSYLSRFMTLHPGDVIATGTPPGVGMGRKPQRFLGAGDTLRLGVEGLGEQRQTVRAA
ncbi:fumarylacetoacetate hydrolase family protein [Sulfurisoma sediminicola]|uniref:2-keto-4-pentenoate hydratase/2-oxohepta-3-ene-1,7-dioic acid hydratase in catechol pathway n=1 Tax=Sulfurisoma sediminicola TaxID=1381557 RepID=A0A497XMT7_9PROT|nr:fumarylacetoacetate hydrolase family protein [Sulfurisoma sediminicola]RLJ67589.1 2-keto-4-pentenoate hydratase/2-oxohepta-3-ene-1,7-dioic acid hydratase in catechol pathway [Sulfurisoma sediminicola]